MFWRKWFVRGLVFSIIGGCSLVAIIYQRWTDPAVVRELVIAKLQELYPGAVVTVDSARLRILGGIQVNELRMSRRDDPDRTEFFHVPSAIIYHDKEKISRGQITLRKVELHRPRLRAVRLKDGTWNLAGILKDRPPDTTVPSVVWHHGTILLEDQKSAQPATTVEINDVNLSLINDPITLVTATGSANSPILGNIQVKATRHRDTREFAVKLKTTGTLLGPTIMQHLAFDCPNLADLAVEARVDLDASLTYRPDQKEPWDYVVSLNASEGKLQHPKLPLPLENLRASLECSNGAIEISNFEARSGPTILKGRGTGQLPCPDQNFEAELEVRHLMFDHKLAKRLPEVVYKLQQLFQASGPTTLRIACARRDGEWANMSGSGAESRFTIVPEGAQICFKHFPFPLHKVGVGEKAGEGGTIEWFPQRELTTVNITAYARERPVTIVGSWQGHGEQVKSEWDISADDLAIEDKLIEALPEKSQKLTHSFHPTGMINLRAHLWREPRATEFRHEYHIFLHDGTVCWHEFPLLLQKVSGLLDIYSNKWAFHNGHGWHGDGEVTIDGNSLPSGKTSAEDGLELKITGRSIALDEDMQRALTPMPQLQKSWESFRPRGRINFAARVDLPPCRPQDLDVLVNVNGAAIEPRFFSYLISDIRGQFRYHKNLLELKQVAGRHNDTTFELGGPIFDKLGKIVGYNVGTVDIWPGGGHYTKFKDLRIKRLAADEALLRAVPKTLRSFLSSLQLTRPVDISTLLIIRQDAEPGSEPDIYWDGKMAVKETQLSAGVTLDKVDGVVGCRGRHDGHSLKGLKGSLLVDQAALFKQQFKKVHVGFEVKEAFPDILKVDLNAPIFGGHLTGLARVELTSALRYEVELIASNIDLHEFGAHNLGPKSQIDGTMEGQLYLCGLGSSADTLDGNGRINVNHGRLYNLPLLLDLLKFLGLRWPDRTAFEDLHADFGIHGSRVNVRQLSLIGNLISLVGKGDFNLDGTDLNLDFRPTWGEIEKTPFSQLSKWISKNILIIEMRGAVDANPDHLKFNKRFVPLISDPLRDLRQKAETQP